MSAEVVLVLFDGTVVTPRGKISPWYIDQLRQALASQDVALHVYNSEQYRANAMNHRQAVIVLVYREVAMITSADGKACVAEIEALADHPDSNNLVIHRHAQGAILADKSATYAYLREAGVAMPERVAGPVAERSIFSNENAGSHMPVMLVEPGHALDQSRYNTEFIPTIQTFRGKSYHVALRTKCVGRLCTAILVRARSTKHGSPSVHNSNTPIKPDLLNHLYTHVVEPRKREIIAISEKIGSRLGLGFYAHDILPDNRSNRIFLCETGYKFDDAKLRERLAPIAAGLPFLDSENEVILGAQALVSEANRLGRRGE